MKKLKKSSGERRAHQTVKVNKVQEELPQFMIEKRERLNEYLRKYPDVLQQARAIRDANKKAALERKG